MKRLYNKLKNKMHHLYCYLFGKELTLEYLEANNYEIKGHLKLTKYLKVEKPVTLCKNAYLFVGEKACIHSEWSLGYEPKRN